MVRGSKRRKASNFSSSPPPETSKKLKEPHTRPLHFSIPPIATNYNSDTSFVRTSTSNNSTPTINYSTQPKPSTFPKPPPIIIDLPHWQKTAKTIIPHLSGLQVTAKLINNAIHLGTLEPDSFRTVQSKLSELNIPSLSYFHSVIGMHPQGGTAKGS